MSDTVAVHGGFTITRYYAAPPASVFAAWTDAATKARWFVGPPGWSVVRRELDVRVGGEEVLHGRFPNGNETLFTARYHDVIADRRLVYAYDMRVGGTHLSVSLATVEITPQDAGARLVFTEQAVFLDGHDGAASRERGTADHLDRLGALLAG
jgi:uncharacterized protein YndB with AHSA1/START domain